MKIPGGEMVSYAAFMHVIRNLLDKDGMTLHFLVQCLADEFPNMSQERITARVRSLVKDGDLEEKGNWLFVPRPNPFPGSVLPN